MAPIKLTTIRQMKKSRRYCRRHSVLVRKNALSENTTINGVTILAGQTGEFFTEIKECYQCKVERKSIPSKH